MAKPKWGANNDTLARDEQKYIRDRIKSQYKKGNKCEICETTENLQFHHYTSLSVIWHKWKKKNNITINGVDEMMEVGTKFIAEHQFELFEDTVTLCKYHHADRLHGIYGKSPTSFTTPKQRRWVDNLHQKWLEGKKV